MSKKIALNQIGYINTMPKTAVFIGNADSFQIVNAKNGKIMFSGLTGSLVTDTASGDTLSPIDFSTFNMCGEYYIKAGRRKSNIFSISENPYRELKNGLLKGMYYSRCGVLDRKFAGEYAHNECHSAPVPLFEDTSKKIDVCGGWHDSGGYGKFSVCTAVTLAHMLYAYSLFPESFSDSVGIPESGNGVPDILNECRVGLEWLMKMQARDGGIFHKVSSVKPIQVLMPEDDHSERYVFPKSYKATLCGCAVLSLASRIFKSFDAEFSEKMHTASINAWIWLINNPNFTPFEDPDDVYLNAAGDFYDENFDDDLFWTVCELYETTGDEDFHNKIRELSGKVNATGFVNRDNGGFGTIAYLFGSRPRDSRIEQLLRLQIRVKADNLYSLSKKSGYGTAKTCDDYIRGSNMYSMTDSITLILAHKIFCCKEYIQTACEQMNYILGKNPMGICYVTGFGSNSVKNPHHRPSEADDVEEPVPGLLVCGPNKQFQDDFTQWNIPSEAPPAKCYYDIMYSFCTNETTIYCTSAAAFVAGYLDSVSKIQ